MDIPVKASKRSRILWWLLLLPPVLVCGSCVGFLAYGSLKPCEIWERVGPVQVLGGPDEVWVFAEKDVMITNPGFLASPNVVNIGHYQTVVVFDATGEKQRFSISKGPSFEPNFGPIFRQEDGFYLIHGQSMGQYRSMFRWSEDHFDLMPIEESEQWLRKVGLDSTRLPEFDSKIDQITLENGWKHLSGEEFEAAIEDEEFSWNGTRFKCEVVDNGTRFRIAFADQVQPFDVTIFDLDPVRKKISRQKSRERFPYEVYGHSKP